MLAEDCHPTGSRCASPDNRSLSSASVLSWTLPATLDAQACGDFVNDIAEAEQGLGRRERRAHAVWLRQLLHLGCLSAQELCVAMASARPFTALHSLEVKGGTRLAEFLEAIVARHSLGGGADWHPALTVDLARIDQSTEPLLILQLDSAVIFCIDSLRGVPARLARLVYASLQLINDCLLPCLLPHDLWREELRWDLDDLKDQFREIRHRAGHARNYERVAQWLETIHGSDFSSDPAELEEQMRRFAMLLYGQPPWMGGHGVEHPIRQARRLLRQIAQYEIEFLPHPWLHYARYVAETILSHCGDDEALRKAWQRTSRHIDQEAEYGVPLAQSLIVSAGGEIESQAAQAREEDLLNQGECATDYFQLSGMRPAVFREIIERCATGLGLLARAEAVNDQVRTGRFVRGVS